MAALLFVVLIFKPLAPREFLSQRYFWHGLLRDQGVGPVQVAQGVSIPSPRGLSALVPPPAAPRESSTVRHGETPKPGMPLGGHCDDRLYGLRKGSADPRETLRPAPARIG